MMRFIALVFSIMGPAAALRGLGQKAELLTDMRPEVVSKLLGEVTNQWVTDFMSVLTNSSDESQAYSKMEKSCLKVTNSVVAGSDGDEDRVAEYMNEVCSTASFNMCTSFAKGMNTAMIGDANFNRNNLKFAQFCKNFWNADVQTAAQAKKEQLAADEKVAAEKKAAEEKEAAEKKAADEKAAAEKKEADEKAAAEKKASEEKAAAEAAEKAAAEKKAAEEKAAADALQKQEEDRAAAEKLRGAIKAKTGNLTAAIEKTEAAENQTYTATEDDVQKLVQHAKKAMQLADKKEADAAKKAKEEKEAAEKKAKEVAVAQQKNMNVTKNVTEPATNETMPAEVAEMMNMNVSQAEEKAQEIAEAKADAIVAKVEKKVEQAQKKA